MTEARLTLESGDAVPRECRLEPGRRVRLGRNVANDIVLCEPYASRFHAVIYREGGRWYVRDSDTVNGTWIDNLRIQEPTALEYGCSIVLGNVCYRFLESSVGTPSSCSMNGTNTTAVGGTPG